MSNIHIIEDNLELNSQLKGFLKFELGDPSIEIHSYYNFESFFSDLGSKSNDDIYIIDYNLGPGRNGFDIYRRLQSKIKYPKTIFFTAKKHIVSEVDQLRRNPSYDKIEVIIKAGRGSIEKVTNQVKDWIQVFKNERILRNILIVKNDIQVINQNLIESISRNPNAMFDLHPRKFEELVAELFDFEGYTVELTPQSNDGGKDIYAYKKDFFNEYLFAVECKRFSQSNKVGRPIVQKLNGVVEHERLTGGIIVTSSFYTEPAKEFTKDVKHRIFLNDFHDLMELIRKYRMK